MGFLLFGVRSLLRTQWKMGCAEAISIVNEETKAEPHVK